LTSYTDYSLRVLIRLALRPDELTTIAEIARVYEISEHHLTKVVHQLGVAGYIDTIRGHGGGLRLARAPQDIAVGAIARRMEPDFGLVACFRKGESCAIAPACVLSDVLEEALDAFLKVLDRYTLADLIGNPKHLSALLALPSGSPENDAPHRPAHR